MVALLLLASIGLLCPTLPVLGQSYADILNDLYGMDRGYLEDQIASRSSPDDEWSLSYRDAATLNDPELFSEAALRDQEYLENSPLWGYQSVSGGTGDGKENPKEVKTDKVLPAYCNPPNPCPLGYTSDDNCVEHFDNTPDNNRRLMKEQDCPCDTEHMLSCPNEKGRVSSKSQSDEALDHVLDDMTLKDPMDEDQYMMTNDHRLKLVAKKSPHMIGKRDLEHFLESQNQYLAGEKLKLVAKKADSKGLKHHQFNPEY